MDGAWLNMHMGCSEEISKQLLDFKQYRKKTEFTGK